VRQRIYSALPLPLGATSSCEWLEIGLTERFEPADIRRKLQVKGVPAHDAELAARLGW
jgi:uncharacterized protein (DUF2344 family)